mmetsp:Transcript_42552/g.121740  ORF Transcript_42552/g.121740 Transcript_42552/m.121740 type:complete len:223 (-) Transcript_42552:1061-1729(-)
MGRPILGGLRASPEGGRASREGDLPSRAAGDLPNREVVPSYQEAARSWNLWGCQEPAPSAHPPQGRLLQAQRCCRRASRAEKLPGGLRSLDALAMVAAPPTAKGHLPAAHLGESRRRTVVPPKAAGQCQRAVQRRMAGPPKAQGPCPHLAVSKPLHPSSPREASTPRRRPARGRRGGGGRRARSAGPHPLSRADLGCRRECRPSASPRSRATSGRRPRHPLQ